MDKTTWTIVPPLLPTIQRNKFLVSNNLNTSLLRGLEYEHIEKIELHGQVLDVGGGNTKYNKIFSACKYESVNIDPKMQPTYIVAEGEPYPCPDNYYDFVTSFNTLEHAYNPIFLLEQMRNKLKSGGKLYLTAPFLYPVHSDPDDYFRPTSSWISRTLIECGFINIKIHPLVWGPYTACCFGLGYVGYPGPIKKLRYRTYILIDIINSYIRYNRGDTHYTGSYGKKISDKALGYFVGAEKS